MKAVVCRTLGDATDPSILCIDNNFPRPPLKYQHLRIRIAAASLNFPDALQVKGEYQVKPKLPFVPGSEESGIVVEVGPGVDKFKLGDQVVAVTQGGAFAEECCVSQYAAWRLPSGVDVATAAAVPIVYGTADLALRLRGQVKPGQVVLVLGAAGGVGVAAVQVSHALGATVVAVVNGSEKAEFMRGMGAAHVVDLAASKEPLSKQIKMLVPKGVDVVFDPVGGVLFGQALKSVKWGAQYLVIGFASGDIPRIPANHLLVKNTTVHGVFWGSYMQHEYGQLAASMKQVMKWLVEGRVKVQVSHRFPLEKVHDAFKVLLERKVKGKVLLLVGGGTAKL